MDNFGVALKLLNKCKKNQTISKKLFRKIKKVRFCLLTNMNLLEVQ